MIETSASSYLSAFLRPGGMGLLVLIAWLIKTEVGLADMAAFTLENSNSIEISALDIYEDQTASLQANDIAKDEIQKKFSRLSSDKFNVGPTDSTFWIRFQVTNKSREDEWFIAARHPIMEVEFFSLFNSADIISVRPFKTRVPTGRVELSTGSVSTFLLRVSSKQIVDLHFDVMSAVPFFEARRSEYGLILLCVGAFVVMGVYNSILYLAFRERIYLFYLAFVAINMHMTLQSVNYPEGINFWFGFDWLSISNFQRPLGAISSFLFAREFLQTRTHYPRWDRVLKTYMYLVVTLIGLSFYLSRVQMFNLWDLVFLPAILILLTSGRCALRLGAKATTYYVLGWGSFLMGLGIYLLTIMNLIPASILTRNILLVGQTAEAFCMCLALSAKISRLRKEKVEAEMTSKAKSDFLAQTNHDIRTPLSVIKGETEKILDSMREHPELKIIKAEQMFRINQSCLIIESILADISDISNIEAGKVQVEYMDVPFAEFMRETMAMMEPKAIKKGLNLRLDLDKDFPRTVQSDPNHLRRILMQLIDNSIKFTEKGEVRVSAALKSALKDSWWVQVLVEDSGIGVKDGSEGRLFQQYSQLDSSIRKKYGGTGLGLYKAKSLAQILGGDLFLSLKQPEKGGASFTLMVKLGAVKGETRIAAAEPALSAVSDGNELRLEGMRFLIADDEPTLRETYSYFLIRNGAAQVEQADNGRMALEKVLSSNFDAVLMDIQMPYMDGVEVVQRMRRDGINIPVLAMTATAMAGYDEKYLKAGFTEYLTKPVNVPLLIDKLAGFHPRIRLKIQSHVNT
ncbi:MAG TPA: 7TM diverse intracellular signaling domain-containing protein [Oligoflexus sp.]|uniref:hybrid sensor histidine kinase/response regulator n=1 Tax=Oligoflexus sp. TaxID=1971216 RepID=UPI002D4B9F35|nr:7TM diverse intracellular signaling domain-containing protein [Oligoflexus sp.]HYX33988.1 7TM diverse intracellular signaling domain-containing protein [Oligoflexus sp.]